eukprot:GDKJ01032468.1.p1 GENE.GDKJ01032468.1~~GDKJ01032468.1.p1  ORF type:complete len:367 (-),score=75.96 GDKJ01032468.1:28-1128(-)
MDEVQRLYDRIIEETIHRVGAKGLLKSENPLLLGKLKTMWSEAVNQKIKESVENARYSSSSGACTSNLDPIKTTHSYQNSTGNSNIHSIKNVNTQLSPDVARNLDVARQYVMYYLQCAADPAAHPDHAAYYRKCAEHYQTVAKNIECGLDPATGIESQQKNEVSETTLPNQNNISKIPDDSNTTSTCKADIGSSKVPPSIDEVQDPDEFTFEDEDEVVPASEDDETQNKAKINNKLEPDVKRVKIEPSLNPEENAPKSSLGGKMLSLSDLPPSRATFDSKIPSSAPNNPNTPQGGENLDDIENLDELVPDEPQTSDVILGQYNNVVRPAKKGMKRWKIELTAGIMQIGGVEIPFGRFEGNFGWPQQ